MGRRREKGWEGRTQGTLRKGLFVEGESRKRVSDEDPSGFDSVYGCKTSVKLLLWRSLM